VAATFFFDQKGAWIGRSRCWSFREAQTRLTERNVSAILLISWLTDSKSKFERTERYRDRDAGIGFTTTYKNVGTAKRRLSSYKTSREVHVSVPQLLIISTIDHSCLRLYLGAVAWARIGRKKNARDPTGVLSES
jgi:hypothetical protein